MSQKTVYLLTGDIGGTNSRMSLYAACGGSSADCDIDKPLCVKYFRNAEHLPDHTHSDPKAFPNHIVIPFLEYCWKTANNKNKLVPLQDCEILACLATAGLVLQNAVQMTNLGNLLVDGTAMEQDQTNEYLKHVTTCRIINDFVAQGYGCLTLHQSEVRHLYGPKTSISKLNNTAAGPKVCVGAGTGLGECYLTPTADHDGSSGSSYNCFPSEGGHVEYAPRNDLELRLWKFLSKKFASKHRISVERVVSGKGLANVYEFLAQDSPKQVNAAIHAEFLKAGDEQGRVVAVHAADNVLCQKAMDVLMGAYGCEVGSAAIKWIPVGGLFVTGGLTPKNIDSIQGLDSEFMQAYTNKGRVSPLLERIPVYAVMTEDLGVRGVHKAAKMMLESRTGGGVGAVTTTTTTTTSKAQPAWEKTLAVVTAVAFGFLASSYMHKRG